MNINKKTHKTCRVLEKNAVSQYSYPYLYPCNIDCWYSIYFYNTLSLLFNRRRQLAQLGSATGVYKTLVKYLVGVPQVLYMLSGVILLSVLNLFYLIQSFIILISSQNSMICSHVFVGFTGFHKTD